jgi:hypothetical protein
MHACVCTQQEVATDFNAGFTSAVAAIKELSRQGILTKHDKAPAAWGVEWIGVPAT